MTMTGNISSKVIFFLASKLGENETRERVNLAASTASIIQHQARLLRRSRECVYGTSVLLVRTVLFDLKLTCNNA